MDFGGLLKIIAQKFSDAHIRYALIGGFALQAAGYTRATGDIDFLIHTDDVKKAKDILALAGYAVIHESEDVLNMANPSIFIGGVDFIKAHRKYALAMLDRASTYTIGPDTSLPSIIAEDIIGLKLQAMGNDASRYTRDLADIEWLISHHRGTMDMKLVEEYFHIFSLEREFKQMIDKIKNA